MEHLELIFIRLLHLLAHHPDFGTTKEELLDAAMYICFFPSSMEADSCLLATFSSILILLPRLKTSHYYIFYRSKARVSVIPNRIQEARYDWSPHHHHCSLTRHDDVELLHHVWDGANPDQRTCTSTLMVAFNLSGKSTIAFRHSQAFNHRGEQWGMERIIPIFLKNDNDTISTRFLKQRTYPMRQTIG